MTNKGLTWIALIALVAGTAYAAIDWEIPNNVMRFGDGSTSEKSLDFNLGLGASNPKLKSDAAGDLTSTTELGSEVGLTVGAGSDTDLGLKFDMNGTADIPEIKWDSGAGALVFKDKPGGTFKKVGSGSGSGGGENYNNAFVDQNFNAEDGTNSWSNSGGTFAVTSVDPLEGEQSFTFTSSAQFDYVESSALNMDRDVFRGQSCEARVSYIGGSDDLYLQLIDGGANVFKELQLPAHGIYGQESLFFLCPNATDIAADANLATLKYRIANKGSGVAPLIKFDTAYLGTLRGLTETTLPDTLTATIQADGTISRTNAPWIDSLSIVDTSLYVINYSLLGLSNSMDCVATAIDTRAVDGNFAKIWDKNFQQVRVRTYFTNSSTSYSVAPRAFSISCTKSGADAKQTVQVYKSIPKVSENVNEFIGYTDDGGSTFNGWGVTVVKSQTGVYDYDISSLGLSVSPRFQITARKLASVEAHCTISDGFGPSNLIFRVACQSTDTGTLVDTDHYWTIQKAKDDFRLPTLQPIIVGQVTNSYAEAASKNVRVEVCVIGNNGTATLERDVCDTWIDSVARTAGGRVEITFIPNLFYEQEYSCQVTVIGGTDTVATLPTLLSSTAIVDTKTSGNANDRPFTITCTGVIP